MGLNFTRALPVAAALLGAAIFSPAANAATVTYDVNFSLTTLFGGTIIGSGSGDFTNSSKFPKIFSSDDLSITFDEGGKDDDTDTFDFKSAVATFKTIGPLTELTSLTGFDAITGDSITLAFLGGLFVDADYCTTDGNKCNREDDGPHDTVFKISDALVANPNLSSATPLPTTWPMMLFGLIGFGLVACRGMKKQATPHPIA